ncbi:MULTISPECIES: helix-turn-helix domain-containing protein [unclassified Paenibacillus]|uniref:helix-turn-helix domain-containing protein n=1 Tax=unclassified Paenibacillus TaxID=185978 RepID=UPI0009DFB29D
MSHEKRTKTTFEERIEIVKYTLTHKLDYQKAAEKYDVSYSQVYAWTQKYQSGQEEALRDRRGRRKPVEELSEQEQLKLRMSRDQNMVPLKSLFLRLFYFIGTSSCPELRTRTCTDCRNGQEHIPITD